MSTLRLREYVQKATFTTSDISGAGNGGILSNQQARQFLRDAIEATVILNASDVFDSDSPKFEVPKISMSNRIMYGGNASKRDLEAARVTSGNQQKPDTDLVTLSTELFKGEVPVGDEVFEDNVERAGLADSIMAMIAEAVGRDLEELAIKSDTDDTDISYGLLNGIVQQLVDANQNVYDAVDANTTPTYKGMFKAMVDKLPSRFRRTWDRLVFYVPIAVADGYAEELANRGTALGDANVVDRGNLRYRGIPVEEVALMSGTQNSVDYSKFCILCDPKNLKTGFHRRVRMEKFRDPREGATSFLPTVRFDSKWAQAEATVLAKNVPAL